MATFQLSDGTLTSSITLHLGGTKPLRLSGLGPDKKTLTPKIVGTAVASIVGSPVAAKGDATVFKVRGAVLGTAQVAGLIQSGTQIGKPGVAPLQVRVIAPLALPASTLVAGGVARLLLIESQSPWYKTSDNTATATSMQWMRLVLENRLANSPAQFGAAGATSLLDIIRANNQFQGFSGYPNLSSDFNKKLSEMVTIANDDSHPYQERFIGFINNAVGAATSPKAIADPSPTGLYGWRTTGSGSPGARFVEYAKVGGNTFYTLKK